MAEIEDEELAEQMKMMERMRMVQRYSNSPADGISWGKEDCVMPNGEPARLFRIDVIVDGFGETYTARIDQFRARQLISSLEEYVNAGNQVEGYV